MPEKTDHEHELFAQNTHIDSWRHQTPDRYWFGDVNRISPEAPVPVVLIGKNEERLGGAANVARNVAALGAVCSLLGIVGKDEAGTAVEKLLSQSGITPYLHSAPGISTTVKLRVIGRQQQLFVDS